MSQQDRVLWLLRHGWVCGTTFLDEGMPRYGARIYELRRRGYLIESRTCSDRTHHHRSRQIEWRIIGEPDRTGQVVCCLDGMSR